MQDICPYKRLGLSLRSLGQCLHGSIITQNLVEVKGQSEPAATSASSSFRPFDGMRFFIWHQMGFITVHLFFGALIIIFCCFCFWFFFPGPDLTHSCSTHLPIFINIVSTLVLYQLSRIEITTLLT